MPSCMNGAQARLTERCWRTAAGSWSLTVVPSVTEPARLIVPVTASSASASVVFPAPEWPTSTTLRTLPGASTTGAGPVTPFSCDFCAMARLPCRTDGADERCSLTHRPPGRCESAHVHRLFA